MTRRKTSTVMKQAGTSKERIKLHVITQAINIRYRKVCLDK
jgi:hypothetical protein